MFNTNQFFKNLKSPMIQRIEYAILFGLVSANLYIKDFVLQIEKKLIKSLG